MIHKIRNSGNQAKGIPLSETDNVPKTVCNFRSFWSAWIAVQARPRRPKIFFGLYPGPPLTTRITSATPTSRTTSENLKHERAPRNAGVSAQARPLTRAAAASLGPRRQRHPRPPPQDMGGEWSIVQVQRVECLAGLRPVDGVCAACPDNHVSDTVSLTCGRCVEHFW